MVSPCTGWSDCLSVLADDLETVLFERAEQEQVRDKEAGAEARELMCCGIIGTFMADIVAGDHSGAKHEMEVVARHLSLLIPPPWPIT